MSRSSPRLITPELLPRVPEPIPRVDLQQPPPEGMRWLGAGERLIESDMHLYRGKPETFVWEKIVGHRLQKVDVGHFARWLVEPKRAGMFAQLLKKKV